MKIHKTNGGLAVLNITSFCNSNCVFCREGKHEQPVNVSLEAIKATILKLKTQGVSEITFMGGETALRNDLEEIFVFVKKYDLSIGLVTNALRFADPVFSKRILRFINVMEISIHAAEREMYYAISGRDCFEKFLQGIKNISMYNQCKAVTFNFVLNSINVSKAEDALRFVKKIWPGGNALFHIKNLRFKGKVKTSPELLLNVNRLRPHLTKALNYAVKNNIGVLVSGFPLCAYGGFEHLSFELLCELRKSKSFLMDTKILTEYADLPHPTFSLLENGHFHRKCRLCSLQPICLGLGQECSGIKNTAIGLMPKKKKIRTVLRDFFKKNIVFRKDRPYHRYRFKDLSQIISKPALELG